MNSLKLLAVIGPIVMLLGLACTILGLSARAQSPDRLPRLGMGEIEGGRYTIHRDGDGFVSCFTPTGGTPECWRYRLRQLAPSTLDWAQNPAEPVSE